MFFYVRSLEGKFKIIQESQIKNFDQSTYDKFKKYPVLDEEKNTFQATVIYFNDSFEELKQKIATSRPNVPPQPLLNTATELSEDEEVLSKQKDVHSTDDSTEQILIQKLKRLEDKKEAAKVDSGKLIERESVKRELLEMNKPNVGKIKRSINSYKEATQANLIKTKTDVDKIKKSKNSNKKAKEEKLIETKTSKIIDGVKRKKKKEINKENETTGAPANENISKEPKKLKMKNSKNVKDAEGNDNTKIKAALKRKHENHAEIPEKIFKPDQPSCSSTPDEHSENQYNHEITKSVLTDRTINPKNDLMPIVESVGIMMEIDQIQEQTDRNAVTTDNLTKVADRVEAEKNNAKSLETNKKKPEETKKETVNKAQKRNSSVSPPKLLEGKKGKEKKVDKKKKSKNEKTDLDVKKLMKDLKKKNERNLQLREECERLRSLLKNQMAETDKWRNLNAEMQTKIYEKMDEFASNSVSELEQIIQIKAVIGFIRKTDNTIHCGNNIYITMTSYNNAKNSAAKQESPDKAFSGSSAFVRDVAVTIVGADQLKNCSVTGRKCNRLNTAPKNKLDSKLLGAVYGIFEYYLKTEKKLNDVDIAIEKKHVGSYIAQKICDFNRKKRSDKKEQTAQKVSETSAKSSDDENEGNKDDDVNEGNKDDENENNKDDDEDDDENAGNEDDDENASNEDDDDDKSTADDSEDNKESDNSSSEDEIDKDKVCV